VFKNSSGVIPACFIEEVQAWAGISNVVRMGCVTDFTGNSSRYDDDFDFLAVGKIVELGSEIKYVRIKLLNHKSQFQNCLR
jgi:hypothetical protein